MSTPGTIEELVNVWESHDPRDLIDDPDWYTSLSRKALELGHPSLAFDILKRGLSHFVGHVEMGYMAALSLARGGSTGAAGKQLQDVMTCITKDDPLYMDVLSLSGRIAKDRYGKLKGETRTQAAEGSAKFYAQAFAESGDYFPGINAATMTLVSGDRVGAVTMARQVLAICETQLETAAFDDYWLPATLGEVCLLLGRNPGAARWYAKAAKLAAHRFGDIASMRRQVTMLCAYLDVDDAVLEALRMPRVVAFAGHMIDKPGVQIPRFPASIEGEVSRKIKQTLDRLDAGFGYSSAACGADLLFIEAMLERGAEVHVVMPFKRVDFIETSIRFAGDQWIERFDRALAVATTVTYACEEGYLNDDTLFQYAADLVGGMTLLRAEELGVETHLLAVLDGASSTETGGTAENVQRWEGRAHSVEIVDLVNLRQTRSAPVRQEDSLRPDTIPPRIDKLRIARQVHTMLFGDVVGFSKLGEEAAPSFFVTFLGEVAKVIKDSDPAPATCNTWGDGLYVVFEDVIAAARFALRLRDMVVHKDWSSVGLPPDTNIRLGMHTGPVYATTDPIIERINYFGSHVNRAARIEPITTPGAVFCTEQTAGLLAARGEPEFACDYLGVVELAKKFGSGSLYRLRRANEVE